MIVRPGLRTVMAAAALVGLLLPSAASAVPECGGLPVTLMGTEDDDVLIGGSGPDVIHGLGGNDQIEGKAGADVLCGGDGDDRITAGDGEDRLIGGFGSDLLMGGGDDDTLFGGSGLDELRGSAGDDVLDGGDGGDRLLGGAGNDHLIGGPGLDAVSGGDGEDHIAGGDGDDDLRGDGGADTISGERGRDLIRGGGGDDTLRGGPHPDTVLAGPGDDQLRGGPGDDVITGGDGYDICRGDRGEDEASECEKVVATEIGQLPPPRIEPSRDAVALTFDDGPHPIYTPPLLDILDRYNVKATFFVLGIQAVAYPEITREIVERGHSVQNHTYRHIRLPYYSNSSIISEFNRAQQAIEKITGTTPRCMRPPYGSTNTRVAQVAESIGLTQVMWDRSAADWLQPPTSTIVRSILRAGGGDVILLHDAGGVRWNTVRAVPYIIEGFRARGLDFETLCD